MSSQRSTGVVKFFDTAKGYGFIGRQHGDDIFVHTSDIRRAGLDRLYEGQQVDFDIKETPKGLQAINIEAHPFTPRQPAEVGPIEVEPVSLASVFYAAALHVLESEDIDPTECVMWHGKSLADVDPKFRIDVTMISPHSKKGHQPAKSKSEILESLGALAGLRLASQDVVGYLRTQRPENKSSG